MSLNDEERKTLVELQMQKANRFLEQAEMVICSSGIWLLTVTIMLVSMLFRPCLFIMGLPVRDILVC